MEILSVVGIGLIAAIMAVILKQTRPEFAMLLSLGAGVVILFIILTSIPPVVNQIQSMLEAASMPAEYAVILFKALGICFVTQIASDTCKDAGESAISVKLEMAGRVAVLVISLPLFSQVLSIVYSLIA